MNLDAFIAAASAELFFESLEELVTSEEGFQLTTATNVQRAACWVIQNGTIPDRLWADELVQKSFGGVRPNGITNALVREVLLLAGVRGAKTLICAAACVWFAIKVDLSHDVGKYMKAGEVPRVSLVSALKDNAKEAFRYITGAHTDRARLKPLLIGEPTMEAISLRHPTGRQVDIRIIAMQGEGVSLVSRWSAGVLFDEAPRMSSAEDADKINLEGMVSAVRSRLLPGCPIMYVGSPIGALGYVYKLFEQNFEKPDQKVVVMKAQGPWLNPFWWTPERVHEFATNPRLSDDYQTDVLANFREVELQLFSVESIDRAMARGPVMLPPEAGRVYTGILDPATRNNACTLVLGTTDDNVRFKVPYVTQWQGSKSKPLDFNEVFPEIKDQASPYGVTTFTSDQFAHDIMRSLAVHFGLGLTEVTITQKLKLKIFKATKTRMDSGLIDLPYHDDLREDLLRVKLVVSSNGEPSIKTPESADGRHCDFAMCIAILCGGFIEESNLVDYQAKKDQLPDEVEQYIETKTQAEKDWLGYDDEREAIGY